MTALFTTSMKLVEKNRHKTKLLDITRQTMLESWCSFCFVDLNVPTFCRIDDGIHVRLYAKLVPKLLSRLGLSIAQPAHGSNFHHPICVSEACGIDTD